MVGDREICKVKPTYVVKIAGGPLGNVAEIALSEEGTDRKSAPLRAADDLRHEHGATPTMVRWLRTRRDFTIRALLSIVS